MTTSFHVAYPGYTGGLVIGGYSSSGMLWVPERPQPGFPSINVFCAQDESIWDRQQKREYAYGWSENFGTGPDGERLSYVSGRVLSATEEEVVLSSENAGGCYQVNKIAATWAGARYWVIATRITNRCDKSVECDFFSGDDPWIGTYKSSDGDVGWTPQGLVRNETHFDLGSFTAGGLWDLGNQELGQKEGSFSNQADFFALDPSLPLPDKASIANRFAHDESELDRSRPLDNRSMTALNLGWTGQHLEPGASLDVAMALGLAETGAPGGVPRLPALGDAKWSRWRKTLEPVAGLLAGSIRFTTELVELVLSKESLTVRGTYRLVNPTAASVAQTIGFPIAVAPDRPAPAMIRFDGAEVPVVAESPQRASASFVVSVPPQSMRSFEVRYTQPHSGRRAEYIVTSARSWGRPLDSAVFRIVSDLALGKLHTSYPASRRLTQNGSQILTIVRQPFLPERELVVTW